MPRNRRKAKNKSPRKRSPKRHGTSDSTEDLPEWMTGQTSIPQPVLRGKLSEQVKFSDLPIPVQQRLYEEQLATFKAEEAAAARLNKQLKASKAQRKTDQKDIMETMLAKLRRNKAHLDKLEDTLASLRAEGAQKQEQCSKELRNQEDVASAAEEHGKVLQTELRFREKALKKTEMQLDEFGKATASRETLMDQLTELEHRVDLRKRLTRTMNTVDFDVGITPMLLEFARAFPHSVAAQAEALTATQHTLFWDSVGKQRSRAHLAIQQQIGPLMQAAMERHPENLHIQIVSCRMLWRTASFFPHLVVGFRSSGCVMNILAGLRQYHDRKRYLYNASGALRALVPQSDRLDSYACSDAALRDPVAVFTSGYDQPLGATAPRGFTKHLEDHMPWLNKTQSRNDMDAVTQSHGERGKRAHTPGKGANRRSSMPGQVDRLQVQPDSTGEETEKQRKARLAKRTLSGGFGSSTSLGSVNPSGTGGKVVGSGKRQSVGSTTSARRPGRIRTRGMGHVGLSRAVSPIRRDNRRLLRSAMRRTGSKQSGTAKKTMHHSVGINVDDSTPLPSVCMELRVIDPAEIRFWARNCLPRLFACVDSFPKVWCFVESAMIVMVTAVESRPWRARFFLHDDLLHVMLRSLTIHLMRPLVQACGLYLLLKAIPKAGPEREAVLKRYRHHELVEHLLGVSVVYAQSRDLPLPSRRHSLPNKKLQSPRPVSGRVDDEATGDATVEETQSKTEGHDLTVSSQGLKKQQRDWEACKWSVISSVLHPSSMKLPLLSATATTLRVLDGPPPPPTPDRRRRHHASKSRRHHPHQHQHQRQPQRQRQHSPPPVPSSKNHHGGARRRDGKGNGAGGNLDSMSQTDLVNVVVRLTDAAMSLFSVDVPRKSKKVKLTPAQERRRRRKLRRAASQRARCKATNAMRLMSPQTSDAIDMKVTMTATVETTTVPILRSASGRSLPHTPLRGSQSSGSLVRLPAVSTAAPVAAAGQGGDIVSSASGPATDARAPPPPLVRADTERTVNFDMLPTVVSSAPAERPGSGVGVSRRGGLSRGGSFRGTGGTPSSRHGPRRNSNGSVGTATSSSSDFDSMVPGTRLMSAAHRARRSSVNRRELMSVLGSPRSWWSSSSGEDTQRRAREGPQLGASAVAGDPGAGEAQRQGVGAGEHEGQIWDEQPHNMLADGGTGVDEVASSPGGGGGGGGGGSGAAAVAEADARGVGSSGGKGDGWVSGGGSTGVVGTGADPLRTTVGLQISTLGLDSDEANRQVTKVAGKLPSRTPHTVVSLFSDTSEDMALFRSEPPTPAPIPEDGNGMQW